MRGFVYLAEHHPWKSSLEKTSCGGLVMGQTSRFCRTNGSCGIVINTHRGVRKMFAMTDRKIFFSRWGSVGRTSIGSLFS
jgi:hypothetical protein